MKYRNIISKTTFKFYAIYIIYTKSYNKLNINVKFKKKITIIVYRLKSNIFLILE